MPFFLICYDYKNDWYQKRDIVNTASAAKTFVDKLIAQDPALYMKPRELRVLEVHAEHSIDYTDVLLNRAVLPLPMLSNAALRASIKLPKWRKSAGKKPRFSRLTRSYRSWERQLINSPTAYAKHIRRLLA